MHRKKILPIIITAALLCGCNDSSETVPAAAPVQEAVSVTEKITETLTVSETSESETSTVTETELSASSAVTEISEPSYDLSEEFYNELEEIIRKYPHFDYYDISLAYEDIDTGFTFMLDPDKHYFSASVMKAPYMLYIYRMALAGKADTGQKLTYSEEYKRSGTGTLQYEEFGTEWTVEELIGLCLEESDNSAFAMLRELYPEDGYKEFMISLGITHEDDAKASGQPQICCESALTISREIYDFIKEGNPYSERLEYHLTHSRNAMILGGENAEVIRKYGWYDGYFHDMAVILGNRDYCLTILTNLDMLEINTREYRLFGELSSLIAEYSDKLIINDASGNRSVITYERQEVKDMALPKDPYMLLSVLNMKLRDVYPSLEELCGDMEADMNDISAAMEKLGYEYNNAENQFIPIERSDEE